MFYDTPVLVPLYCTVVVLHKFAAVITLKLDIRTDRAVLNSHMIDDMVTTVQ